MEDLKIDSKGQNRSAIFNDLFQIDINFRSQKCCFRHYKLHVIFILRRQSQEVYLNDSLFVDHADRVNSH